METIIAASEPHLLQVWYGLVWYDIKHTLSSDSYLDGFRVCVCPIILRRVQIEQL